MFDSEIYLHNHQSSLNGRGRIKKLINKSLFTLFQYIFSCFLIILSWYSAKCLNPNPSFAFELKYFRDTFRVASQIHRHFRNGQ